MGLAEVRQRDEARPVGMKRVSGVQDARMLAAICAICSSECVRALRAYGISAEIGRYSIANSAKFWTLVLPCYPIFQMH